MKVYREFILKNGKKLILRSAEKYDAEAELSMYKQQVSETPFLSRGINDQFPTADSFAEYYQEQLENPKACTLVAIYEGKLIGSGHTDWYNGRKRNLHICNLDMGILKEYWGLGIGGKIMQTLIEVSKQAGLEQIELNVAKDNTRAIKMYESFGFVQTGTHPHAMKYEDGTYADFVFMVKFL